MLVFELFKCKSCGLETRRKRLAQLYCSERCRNSAVQNRKRRKGSRSGDSKRAGSPIRPEKRPLVPPLLGSGDRAPKNTNGNNGFWLPKTTPLPPFTWRVGEVTATTGREPLRKRAAAGNDESNRIYRDGELPTPVSSSNPIQCGCLMPRPRQRSCLDQGLKLDLNKLARQGLVRPGARTGPNIIRWLYTHSGETIATGLITTSMEVEYEGWLRIQIGNLDQTIILVSRARHFGGRQWYFVCPVMNRCSSVVWIPPGASRFCCRQAWGRRVAYATQFADPDNRAHIGKAKIKSRLIADLDPEEWELPPKPKWMRWRTYSRYVERFDGYESMLDDGVVELIAKLLRK